MIWDGIRPPSEGGRCHICKSDKDVVREVHDATTCGLDRAVPTGYMYSSLCGKCIKAGWEVLSTHMRLQYWNVKTQDFRSPR